MYWKMTSTSLLICLIAAVNGAKPPASEHHTSASPPYPIKRAGLENAPRTRSNAMGTAIPLGTATSHTIPSSTDIGNVFTKMCDTSTATGNNSIETISCFCRDGERRDLAIPSTSPYDPCPNTVAQPTTVTKTKGPQYGCTLTNFEAMGQTTDGLVVACEHCDKQRFGGPGPAGAWVQRVSFIVGWLVTDFRRLAFADSTAVCWFKCDAVSTYNPSPDRPWRHLCERFCRNPHQRGAFVFGQQRTRSRVPRRTSVDMHWSQCGDRDHQLS